LKRRTEKTTPKERPRDERMRREERQRSHWHLDVSIDIRAIDIIVRGKGEVELAFSFRRASLTGLLGRAMGAGGGGIDVSGMAVEDCQARCELSIGFF
jgi:hypothetical protein